VVFGVSLVLFASACNAPSVGPVAAHQPGRILGARDIGRANPNEIVDLVIGLRTRPGAPSSWPRASFSIRSRSVNASLRAATITRD
jgi:hypothetical protein